MANRTDPNAISVHGTNPQHLIEKIVRLKIHACQYWKEHCYALTAETLVDKAVELEYVGGTYGGSRKPAPFICLILKMLQLQPELEIVYEFIKNKDYKYVTALGCFYLRLIGKAEDIYFYLEPLYNDYRKLRYRETDGKYRLIHVDEFIDELLLKEAVCDTILPHISKRQVLEESGALKPRHSVLEDLDEDDETLLEEIRDNGATSDQKGVTAGADELIENPRAEGLRPNRSSEENSKDGQEHRDKDDEERRKKKDKKRHKKEKKKTKYRTRGSISRSRSRHRNESDRSEESRSKSRSRSSSRSEKKKKKKSKWKKQLKEKRREKSKEKNRDRSNSREKKEKNNKDKDRNEKQGKDVPVNENSEEYWISLRAKAGLKPL